MKIFRGKKKSGGFSLVELVLYIAVSGLIFGVTAQAMMTQLESYVLISERQNTLSDVRYTLNRIAGELLHLETGDILAATSQSLTFLDEQSAATSFSLDAMSTPNAVLRGTQTLLSPVQDLQFTYYDQNEIPTVDILEIRKIEISITSQASGDEGNITLSTMITPRSFVYSGYQ